MKYLAIIQARCGSFRLPGKVLKELCGKTDLEWVIERVKKSRYVDEVIVATSMNEEDVPIVKLVSSLGLRVFAGSPDDVLDRYYQAAKLIKPEYVIRITADSTGMKRRIYKRKKRVSPFHVHSLTTSRMISLRSTSVKSSSPRIIRMISETFFSSETVSFCS